MRRPGFRSEVTRAGPTGPAGWLMNGAARAVVARGESGGHAGAAEETSDSERGQPGPDLETGGSAQSRAKSSAVPQLPAELENWKTGFGRGGGSAHAGWPAGLPASSRGR